MASEGYSNRVGTRRGAWMVLLVLAAALCAVAPGVAQAANANFLGTWRSTAGNWTISSQEPGGSCAGTSSFGYEMKNCGVSGNAYKFLLVSGGYESHNHGTIEGNKVTGEFNDTAEHNVPYVAYRQGSESMVAGQILNQNKAPEEGVKVTLTGTSESSEAVNKTTTTNIAGGYSFEVAPGTYAVAATGDPPKQYGGELAVAVKSGTPECSGTAKEATCNLKHLAIGEQGSASFTYTECGSPERTVEGHEPTNCPIVFVPGILGSKIVCKTGLLYISLKSGGGYFKEMELQPNGEQNATVHGCNASAEVPSGEEGLLMSVAGVDAYKEAWEYIKRIATNGAYVYPFDWRLGVEKSSPGLGTLVEKALSDTGAKHVVLVAHSMGGLVVQQYIDEGQNAKNVIRALTIGTPYWGAPKSMIALLDGHTNEFATEKADRLFGSPEVQKAVGNYTGLYWLYPSSKFGPWLEIEGSGYPKSDMSSSEIGKWVASLGGTPAVLQRALSGHDGIASFNTNGVDYQIVVSAGLATITHMDIAVNDLQPEQWVVARYGSGDGTVPVRSETEGAFPGETGGAGVPINYVCGIRHAEEPAAAKVQNRIKDFILTGGKIEGSEPNCPFSGAEIVDYHTAIAGHGAAASVTTPAGTVTLAQAVSKGLLNVLELGNETIITTDNREPVKLALSGSGMSLRVRAIDNNEGGQPVYYGPVNGTIVLNRTTITRGSKKLKPAKRTKPPRVVAHVTRRGKSYLVRMSISGKGKAVAIYYRLGNGTSRRYTRTLHLSRKQLRMLRFSSLGQFGEWGPTGHARVPG